MQEKKIKVGVVGATGLAGQQFVSDLVKHPWFDIKALAASERSAGKTYKESISSDAGQVGWYAPGPFPDVLAETVVQDARKLDASVLDVVFTAIDSGPSKELEPLYAKTTPVISTASAFRYEDDVPVIIPGVNSEHAELFKVQQKNRGFKGFITPNPNCTVVGLAISLAPLESHFGIDHAHVVSMQAVSGAGRSPGVIALDVVDNIIPYIPNEEEKVSKEALKICGKIKDNKIEPSSFKVIPTCTRVGVLEGHTEVVHIELKQEATYSEISKIWGSLGAEFLEKGYPSAPKRLISLTEDPFRPQVRLDRDCGDGMSTVIGRLRSVDGKTSSKHWQYMLVSHNTKMGASKGCLLLAEHLVHEGWISSK